MSREQRSRPRRPTRTRRFGLGCLSAAAGVLMLLFAGHTLVWTNVESAAATEAAVTDLRGQWGRGATSAEPGTTPAVPGTTPAVPGTTPPVSGTTPAVSGATPAVSGATPAVSGATPPVLGDKEARTPSAPVTERAVTLPPAGEPFALMSIPRLGAGWTKPIIEGSGHGPGGISADDLARGVAHYPGTALPGETGNFAVAGHRTTYGQPFRHLDRVVPGDEVVVETSRERLTYTVERSEIVTPVDERPLWAVPFSRASVASEPVLTLTTCHPAWSAAERLIVIAVLTKRSAVARQ